MIDTIVVILVSIFLLRGWAKGFFFTILDPISLILGITLALAQYRMNNNIFTAFLIVLFGPFVLRFFMKFILNFWKSNIKKDERISTSSKILGSAVSFLWGGAYLVLFLIVVVSIPLQFSLIRKTQSLIITSKTYNLINTYLGEFIPFDSINFKRTLSVLQNPDELKKLQGSKEFKNFMEDKNIQDYLNDEETQKLAEEKNFAKLLAHPKMQAILKDKKTIKKLLTINQMLNYNDRGKDKDINEEEVKEEQPVL